MSGITVRFHVPEAAVAEFRSLAEEDVAESRKEPGCLRFDVVQHGATEFSFIELYVSESAAKAHTETPHFAKWARFRDAHKLELAKTPISVACGAALPAAAAASRSVPRGAIDHIVAQKLRRPLNDEELLKAQLMRHLIPGVIKIECGENLTMRGKGYNCEPRSAARPACARARGARAPARLRVCVRGAEQSHISAPALRPRLDCSSPAQTGGASASRASRPPRTTCHTLSTFASSAR